MKLLLIILFLCSLTFSQITKQDIETVLILDGQPATKSDQLYKKYIALTSYRQNDFLQGLGLSALSGVSLGFYESKNYGYKYTNWLPASMRYWYESENNSEHVFGKFFTWQKFWREVDYISDAYAYMSWLRFFGNKWYLAYPVHWIVKNLFATLIRDKAKFNDPFHSFNLQLIF